MLNEIILTTYVFLGSLAVCQHIFKESKENKQIKHMAKDISHAYERELKQTTNMNIQQRKELDDIYTKIRSTPAQAGSIKELIKK